MQNQFISSRIQNEGGLHFFSVQLPINSYHQHVFHNSRYNEYLYVLQVSAVDNEGHVIQLVIVAIQSSFYWNETSFGYIFL